MVHTRMSLWWLILILPGFAALAGCSGGAPGSVQASTSVEEDLGPFVPNTSFIAGGRVVPLQEASLSFITGGVVDEVLVCEGETVQVGQVLARLTGDE